MIQIDGHNPLEIGMIGHEGMLGAAMALGIERHAMRAIVQGSGHAHVIAAEEFRQLLLDNPEIAQIIRGYLFVIGEQLAQTTACNTFHEVPARLARWLLMTDDRAQGGPHLLTHRFLADMLGVRRSAVTIAAGQMQEDGLISYKRGQIHLLSRERLQEIACDCYSADLSSYRRQFDQP
jgi:CRP-like cAMP-binding protein